jgi:hypothetical protein
MWKNWSKVKMASPGKVNRRSAPSGVDLARKAASAEIMHVRTYYTGHTNGTTSTCRCRTIEQDLLHSAMANVK